jgi:EAL domain-containing protein (putative c-di-GMP-specific phosphodiesterase class I)
VYQPKVSIASGEIVGCEALARWQHHELGPVSPATFVPLAEETGLIYNLGEQVLTSAVKATKYWRDTFGYQSRTAINLSALQFKQTDLIDIIGNILAKHGLTGSAIELEITEGMLMTNPKEAIAIMQRLREKDIHLSIDDFGTGYASLAQLKKFPINTLKIDKAFIDDININERDASVAKAIISLSQNLGLSTVAEGVEDFNQVEKLKELDCDVIQGYVYSRPISAEEFEKLLAEKLTLNQVRARENAKVLNFPA